MPVAGEIRGGADFCNVAPSVLIHYMDDHVDTSPAFLLDVVQRDASSCASHGELRQTPQRISSAVGMNGRKRSPMAGVQSIEEDTRLRASNLAHNYAVRPVTKGGFEQIGKPNLILVRIKLGLGRDDVRLPDMEFGHIFQDQDAITVRNGTGKYIGERRLSRRGTPRDKEIVATPDAIR